MSSNEVKVGAVTLGGAALLAGMISFMGAFSFGEKGYDLRIDYPHVSGLIKGNVVRYAGVQVGTVKAINIAPDKVEVVAKINDGIKIPEGATFSISADGMMSEKFVSIAPPTKISGSYIAEGSSVKGVPGGGMDEFFNASGDLVNKMEKIADGFDAVFGDKEVQAAMRDGFKNMSEISKHMNEFTNVMAQTALANQKDITQMVQQMNLLTQHMESVMAGIDNNGATGRNIAVMAANMADVSKRMDTIAKSLESVAKDPETVESLKGTIINLKKTTDHANKILGTVANAELTADVGTAAKGGDWRSNMGVTLKPTDSSYVYLGGYDIGDRNKFDFIYGKQMGAASASLGSMQGDFGVGFSYDFGKRVKLYSQAYDFDDVKIRLGGELKLNDTVSLYGESMNLKGSKKDTYMGMRARF
ncbi:MAG: MlaD family protein [Phascolarctobacterium sp.]|nr:MlaD family protein [Phascolarctobacterium sp.]